MNPDAPKPSREEIEAKLTALLLGELPAEEAALLRWAIAQDAGLAALHERLSQTIGLVREVAAQPEETPADATALKLSQERRAKLLAHFQASRPAPLLPPLPARAGSAWTRRRAALSSLATIAAVLALVAMLAALVLPNFVRARNTSQRNSTLNNLRQLDAAKQQWALENKKPADAVPTMDDLKPYIRGEVQTIAGENYTLGKVSESPVASLGGQIIRTPGAEGESVSDLAKAEPSRSFRRSIEAVAAEPQAAAASPLPPLASPPAAEIVLPRADGGKAEGFNLDAVTVDYTKHEGERAAQAAKEGGVYRQEIFGYNNLTLNAADKNYLAAVKPAIPPPAAVRPPDSTATWTGSRNVSGGWSSDGSERAQLPPVTPSVPLGETAPGDTTVAGMIHGKANLSKVTSTLKSAEGDGRLRAMQDDTYVLTDRESGVQNGKQTPPARTGTLQWDGTLAGNWEEKELGGGRSGGSGGGGGDFGRASTGKDSVAKAPGQLAQAQGSTAPSDLAKLTKDFSGELKNTPAKQNAEYFARSVMPADPQANPDTPAVDAKGRAYAYVADDDRRSAELTPSFNFEIGGRAEAIDRPDVSDVRKEAGVPSSRPQASLRLPKNTFGVTPPASGPAPAEELAVLEKVKRQASAVSATEAKKGLEEREKLVPLVIELPKPLIVGTPVPIQLPGASSGVEVALKRVDKPATDADGDKLRAFGDVPVSGEQFANKSETGEPVEGLKRGTKLAGEISGVSGLTRDDVNGLAKSGTGSFTLAGQNTYAGGTIINGGTLGVEQRAAEKSKEEVKEGQRTPSTIKVAGSSTVVADPPAPKAALPAPIPQPEILARSNAFSTFSLNVSDVSFKLAAASLEQGALPEAASIRSEEFINAFDYRDPEAAAGQPLAFVAERARYPFAHNRDLLRFSVKTAAAGRAAGRALNLVLLLDNSGSMERADRVAIIRESLRVLAAQLQPQDTVSVVTFARTARLWADGVRGDQAGKTLAQVSDITPEGGTNLEEAMRLAYATARRHYRATGMNRVVLLTDGAANLGDVNPAALKAKVEAFRQQGIALDCFGIGSQDFNDDLLEQLSRNGDGRYAFLNSPAEASTEFAAKLAGALQVAASDVKVQVEFNPQRVTSYRQIGYAKHQLTKEQFRDNTVDAAEIAAQEAGNALYTVETRADGVGPIATVRVRYKVPGTTEYRETSWEVAYTGGAAALEQSSPALRLAATASAFSEWLAASPFAQEVTPDALLKLSRGLPEVYGADVRPTKLEWMIRQAKRLAGK